MMNLDAAIVGIGHSNFARGLPDSQLRLAATAFKNALADAGLERADVDGLSIHLGWPLGPDYDRVAEGFGLEVRYVNQAWLHGRFVTNALQHAALAVCAGLADVVACVTAISFTRERGFLGGPGDVEGNREEGGTHGEAPPYGLTAPAGGAALAMQRYMHVFKATSEQLAAVPLTLQAHQNARMVVDPLRLYDCCLISDGAVVVLVARSDRAKNMRQKPIRIAGMQGIRSGRDEFIFATRGLGINQQSGRASAPRDVDQEVFKSAGIERGDVQGFYTYDAFSP